MISKPCLIILNQPTAEEREAVQEAVKKHANGWWHHFTDVWIAGGRTETEWQKIIAPLIPRGPSALLVLALPSRKDERRYGAVMRDLKARTAWIDASYQGNK